jgi:SAM-dependent methyltransferase
LERVAAEQDAWDRVAAARGGDLKLFHDITVIWQPVYDQLLGALDLPPGSRVLDCGCGEGLLSASAARRGWSVVGFDVSGESLRNSQRFNMDLAVHPTLAAFESLPFADGSFDAAVGMFVLHHVDLPAAAGELRRILGPGGRARFVETWGHNPLLRAGRALTGRLGVAKWGTDDERPLRYSDVDALRQAGLLVTLDYPGLVMFQLIDNNVLRQRWSWATKLLRWIDATLGRFSALKKYGYYVIFDVRV